MIQQAPDIYAARCMKRHITKSVLVNVRILYIYSNHCHPTFTINHQRNELETQGKSLMLLMLYPWYDLIRFTLKPCTFTLNIFQDFAITYFKQELQCLWNYRILKLPLGIIKRWMFALFLTSEIPPPPIPWSSKGRWLHRHCRSCSKYVNTK